MNLDSWVWSYSGMSKLNLEHCSYPFYIEHPLVAVIYDPFDFVKIRWKTLKMLFKAGCSRSESIKEDEDISLFDDAAVASFILSAYLTPNTYVFTKDGYKTNAICLIKENEADVFLAAIREANLCGVVYAGYPLDGFDLIQLNYEDQHLKTKIGAPHLTKYEVWDETRMENTKLPRFNRWYAKMVRYKVFYTEQYKPNQMISYIQWSWMKFLLPLATCEDTTNIPHMMNYIWRQLDTFNFVKNSLKMVLNGLKCHVMQIVGVTNLVAYNHKLIGNEVPLRNFRYFIDSSMIQWLHVGNGADWKEILLDSWQYENDWNCNELQKMILRVYIYTDCNTLIKYGFPLNINAIYNENKRNIVNRRCIFDRGKLNGMEIGKEYWILNVRDILTNLQ